MPYNKLLGIHLDEPFHGPFFLRGSLLSVTNDTAIFAILGWSEQPKSMQPFAQKMQNLGHSVAVPSYLINQADITCHIDWVRAIWTQLLELRQRGIRKIHLVGFSLGGLIALQLATQKHRLEQKYGLQIMKVAVICPPSILRWKWRLPTETLQASTFDRQLVQQISTFYPAIPFPHTEYVFENYRGSEKHRSLVSIMELIHAIRFTNLMLKKNILSLPVLIVVAKEDELVDSKRTCRLLKKRIQQAEVKVVPGRHNLLLNDPNPVCHAVHAFITQN
jgi:esterase/lipase